MIFLVGNDVVDGGGGEFYGIVINYCFVFVKRCCNSVDMSCELVNEICVV